MKNETYSAGVRFACGVVMGLALTGCETTPKEQIDKAAGGVLGRGWQCLLVPTGFLAPGSIFEVTAQGVHWDVVDNENKTLVGFRASQAGFGAITDNRSISTEIAAGLLKGAVPNVEAQIKGSAASTSGTYMQFTDVHEEKTEGDADVAALNYMNAAVKAKTRNVDPNSRYFVVREAYSAKTVKYDVSSNFVAALGGEAELRKKLGVTGKVFNIGDKAAYVLEQTFDSRLRACIKSREIVFSAGGGGERPMSIINADAVIPKINSIGVR